MYKYKTLINLSRLALLALALMFLSVPVLSAQVGDGNGSIGIEGRISAPAPTIGATISSPGNGASFANQLVTITGVCSDGLLVKLFKNGVFAGSAPCSNGSYSIQTDLFNGANEFVAIVYDDLDQQGPDSNRVTVNYTGGANTSPLERVQLTSDFARRGANPGETIYWPIVVSGGQGPYAISIDWGDGTQDSLVSVRTPGEFTIDHAYDTAGTYTIIIKATDVNGRVAYIQLVGVGNGSLEAIAETGVETQGPTTIITRVMWQPVLILVPFIISTFWLGKKYELKRIRTKIERGELPFNLG